MWRAFRNFLAGSKAGTEAGENRTALGARGEDMAVRHLEGLGYRIIERNFRSNLGEIDIVAEDRGALVFVEVKTRRSDRFGSPEEAVNARKREKLRQVALSYLSRKGTARPARFDIVTVMAPKGGRPSVSHTKDAFEVAP